MLNLTKIAAGTKIANVPQLGNVEVVKYEGMGTYMVKAANGKHYRLSGFPCANR